jgi:hypothetical protein
MFDSTSRYWRLMTLTVVLVGLVALLAAGHAQPVAAQGASTTYSGQATVVRATVLGTSVVLADTGPLPESGGAQEAALLEAEVPGLLTAEVLHASTVGQGDQSRSEASVANLGLTVGGNTITADFLMSRAAATCQPGGASVSGSSEVVGLVINDTSIAVTGEPNQTVALPVGQVIINEQESSVDGKTAEITVNALHVIVDGVADVVISSAHADITCKGKTECPGNDFMTGGGWITETPSGAKGNFGVAGGIKNGGLWGHLTFIDHGDKLKVKGTGVTNYEVVDETTRRIDGTARVNGEDGFSYTVVIADNGEPGRDDTFSLNLSNGYDAAGDLDGGNIQLHQPCQ